jgi:hypothetical protein
MTLTRHDLGPGDLGMAFTTNTMYDRILASKTRDSESILSNRTTRFVTR